MIQYYYSDKTQPLGPFTFEELKTKRIRKSTLVWRKGLSDWTFAANLEELKDIIISEPPPLPKPPTKPSQPPIIIKPKPGPPIHPKGDYEKEIDATFVGVSLLIADFLILLKGPILIEDVSDHIRAFLGIISLCLRIFVTFWVIDIAKRQNRNFNGWGWFAFLLPEPSLIIIGLLNKLPLTIEIDESLSIKEQCEQLKEKSDELTTNSRHVEALSVLLKIQELNNNFPEINELIKICKAKIEQTKNNKKTNKEILENGQIIEFIDLPSSFAYVPIGTQVTIGGQKPEDCVVKLQNTDIRYEIKNGKIYADFYISSYKQTNGSTLELDGNRMNGIVIGSRAWINDNPAPDGAYKKGFLSKVTIKNGRVNKLRFFS